MSLLHQILGFAVVGALLVIALFGLGLKIARREEAPRAFWILEHYTENVLIAQVVIGLILFLVLGRRVVGDSLIFLHYFYGSLFPVIAIVAGRIAGLRRERQEFVGPTWGAFFAFGLTLRALMTGMGWGV